MKRTGYCGVKIELPRPLKVEGYEGLELRVRTDGRNYVTNLEVRAAAERRESTEKMMMMIMMMMEPPNHKVSIDPPTFKPWQVSSFFPDELYQGYITGLPGGRWFTLQLPFRDMTLTRLGRLSYIQRDLDGGFTLESIGEPASLWVGLDVCVRSICRGGVTNAHLTSPTQSQHPHGPTQAF